MVAPLVLVRDNNGGLHDQEGHPRDAAGQRIDAQGAAIPEPDATTTRVPEHRSTTPTESTASSIPGRFYLMRSSQQNTQIRQP
ncbi:hypothetical protein F2Q69_00035912 [Brassica cretica]|uniref:Uncharacterized protein n=1 Tax=Brassica cretica TaxID=69181 RepID=A0A8S9SG98_BRACR|nr:hypothetical protein F2Q69_00035912 [Brassica cretica]